MKSDAPCRSSWSINAGSLASTTAITSTSGECLLKESSSVRALVAKSEGRTTSTIDALSCETVLAESSIDGASLPGTPLSCSVKSEPKRFIQDCSQRLTEGICRIKVEQQNRCFILLLLPPGCSTAAPEPYLADTFTFRSFAMPDTGRDGRQETLLRSKSHLETRGRVQCEVRLSPGGYSSTCAETLPIGNGQNDDDEGYGPTLPFHKDERRIPNNAFVFETPR